MNSSIVVKCFKVEIIMWYDEKDANNEVVKDYLFMCGNENTSPDTVFTVSEKYGVNLRICSSGLKIWEGKNVEAFENRYSKVVKLGYDDFINLPLKEREEYTEKILEDWNRILELSSQLKLALEQLKANLQKEAGNRKLLKIGIGINKKTNRPNFQIWLEVSSLLVLVTSTFNGKSVSLRGTLQCAKNWHELQEGNYDEVDATLVLPFETPGTTRHKFQLTGLLSPEATKNVQEIEKKLWKARTSTL